MGRYYCDYCDAYLTHDSPSVRKTHCSGRKHKDNVRIYYQKWMEEQAKKLLETANKGRPGVMGMPGYSQAPGFAIPPPGMISQGFRPNMPMPMQMQYAPPGMMPPRGPSGQTFPPPGMPFQYQQMPPGVPQR